MTLTPRSSTRIKRVEVVPLINGVYTSEVSDDCCGSQLSFRSMKLCGLHSCLFHSTMGLATKPLVPSIEIGVHTLPTRVRVRVRVQTRARVRCQRLRGHTFTKCRFVRSEFSLGRNDRLCFNSILTRPILLYIYYISILFHI